MYRIKCKYYDAQNTMQRLQCIEYNAFDYNAYNTIEYNGRIQFMDYNAWKTMNSREYNAYNIMLGLPCI